MKMEISVCNLVNFLLSLLSYAVDYIIHQPIFILFGSFLFAIVFVTHFHLTVEICEFWFGCKKKKKNNQLDYDYGMVKGPRNWKSMFNAACGVNQSPINIQTSMTSYLPLSERLMWSHYDELPSSIFIENNGFTVILRAQFCGNSPTISGADFLESYSFTSLCFRWSYMDGEGSEHAINDTKFPMEMQATHTSRDAKDINVNLFGDVGIITVSYFYAITKYDNPFLDPIISNLYLIRKPGTSVQIPSFPLSWLCYPFKSGFYTYGGSRTDPPCTEGVTWIIHPEPLAISIKQIIEFRSMIGKGGISRIINNCRPVQELNSRRVCFNRYDPAHEQAMDFETDADDDDEERLTI